MSIVLNYTTNKCIFFWCERSYIFLPRFKRRGWRSSLWLLHQFLCPRRLKNDGGALSVTPVRPSVRPLSKFGVRSIIITFERLHRFNSNLVCWYIISKHRWSSIWVTMHLFLTEIWAFYKNSTTIGVRSITF